jgi:hypothetical protein
MSSKCFIIDEECYLSTNFVLTNLNDRKRKRVMPTKMMRMVEADLVTAVVIRLTLAGRVGIGREVDGAGVAARQVSVLCQQKNAFFSF